MLRLPEGGVGCRVRWFGGLNNAVVRCYVISLRNNDKLAVMYNSMSTRERRSAGLVNVRVYKDN